MEPDRSSILDSLGQARRFADPSAPLDARLMAAQGALPLPPDQLVCVLYALTLDPESEVKDRALQSLEQLPDRVLEPALNATLPAPVLGYFAERFRDNEARLERIALNPQTSNETLCFLASLPLARIVDIVAGNQLRLLETPRLVEVLGENPVTSQATIDRVLEFLNPRSHGEGDGPAEGTDEPQAVAELPPELTQESGEADEADEEEVEEKSRNLLSLLQDMNVVEKIKLARFGNKEARSLLVRDRNTIVASAAIRSPKVGENEVIQFAKARNVSDEVLRIIANTREWTRSYQVQLALACNPKAPLPSAIKFLNYLTDRDLKNIMRSRDVPTPVAQQARRILSRKGRV